MATQGLSLTMNDSAPEERPGVPDLAPWCRDVFILAGGEGGSKQKPTRPSREEEVLAKSQRRKGRQEESLLLSSLCAFATLREPLLRLAVLLHCGTIRTCVLWMTPLRFSSV